MRIENNNNLNFKAYFKDDAAGHFKRLFNTIPKTNKTFEDIELLKHLPNHELEILSVKETEYESNIYEIFNTVTKKIDTMNLLTEKNKFNDRKESLLTQLVKRLCVWLQYSKYFETDKLTDDLYKGLTNKS